MKKTATMLCASLLLTIGFFSCGKETQSTTKSSIKFYVKVRVSPPLQSGQNVNVGSNNNLKIYNGSEETRWYGVSETLSLSELNSKEITVNSGLTYGVNVSLYNQYDLKCRTITLEGIQNGKVIKSYVVNMGASPSGTECKDGGSVYRTFIIE